MFKKVVLAGFVVVLALVMSTASALADDDTNSDSSNGCPAVYNEDQDIWITAYFCDGRLNAYDMTEPVAVYYTYETVPTLNLVTNDDGEDVWEESSTQAVSGIEVWGVDGDGVGYLIMQVPLATIEAAFQSADQTVLLGSADGVTLSYSAAADTFWVAAPGYSFTWAAW